MRLRGQLGLGSSRTVAGGAFFELSAVFPGDLLRLGLLVGLRFACQDRNLGQGA